MRQSFAILLENLYMLHRLWKMTHLLQVISDHTIFQRKLRFISILLLKVLREWLPEQIKRDTTIRDLILRETLAKLTMLILQKLKRVEYVHAVRKIQSALSVVSRLEIYSSSEQSIQKL